MVSRAGGGTTTDTNNKSTLSVTMQELASAGPSAIESFGPEPDGEVVYAEISVHPDKPLIFRLRCGLASAGRVL